MSLQDQHETTQKTLGKPENPSKSPSTLRKGKPLSDSLTGYETCFIQLCFTSSFK